MDEMRLKQAMLDKLTHEMAVLKRLKFAAQSEAFNAQQHSLLEETIETDLEALAQEIEQLASSVPAEREKKQPKRLPVPPELPRREIRHEPESTACGCGCQLRRIGEDVAEKLDCQPGVFSVDRHVRGKWACTECQALVQASTAVPPSDCGSEIATAVHLRRGTPAVHSAIPMNDLEFAQRISARIGELYGEAKRSRYLFPEHALIQTRALASLCCDILCQDKIPNWPNGLDEKIGALVRAHRINADTRQLLHHLRHLGNAAAHPEASLLDAARLTDLAGNAHSTALALLEIVFRQQHGGAASPAYEVVDEHPDELKDVCYRALIDNSSADQYQVAMLLRRQLAAQVVETEASADPVGEAYTKQFKFGALERRALDLLRYASDEDYPPARYAYGLELAQGKRGDNMVAYGVNLIAKACRDGDIDALAWFGHAALYGLHDEPVDYERARAYLEPAAAEDHPLALSLLSQIYRDGLGVAPDAHVAFELTLRAAEAGYPAAKHNAAVALFTGVGTQRDKQAAFAWLRQASESGEPNAQLAAAQFVRRGELPGGVDEAVRLLLSAMRGVNEARLELADLYISQAEEKRWITAVKLVQEAYETALGERADELAEQCRAVAPGWIAKIEALLRNGAHARLSDKDVNELIMTRFLFDEYGRPYPNRMERLREFRHNVMALSQLKSSGSSEQGRLIRNLTSGMEPAPTLPAGGRRPASLAPVVQRTTHAKVGRNERCPCGSGRKYKACCG